MGYINEPIGVIFTVEKKKLTKEAEERLIKFVEKSKEKNKALIKSLSLFGVEEVS